MGKDKREKVIRVLQTGFTSNYGGVESFIMELYRNIDRTKIQFDFLTAHDGKIAFEDEIKALGGNIYRVTYRKKENLIKHYTALYQFFKNHPEIDAVHMNCCFLNYILPLKMAKKFGIKTRIFHAHNSANMYGENFISKIIAKYNRWKITKIPTNRLACSKEAGDYMFGQNSFQVIENGIDTEKFKYDETKRNKIVKELKIEGKKVIGFCGRLQEQKNPMFVLKVFHELYQKEKNVCLLVVGDGNLKENMLKYIQENDLENAVYFLGLRKDIDQIYNAMDVFFLPSKFEGLGIVLLEAQANGLTCVTSQGIPDEVCITDLVKRLDLEAPIEIWVNELLRSLKRKPDQKYHTMVRDKYGIHVTVNKMEEIYLK